ncbi:MAG: CtsR family transcriptional regulator [Bacillota bacterium]|jgi:transcriptional regulator CtsR|nr:CtsR family transcriptional regulator [Bacillota bacterium]HOC06810.1 CtsR family transcriptional regulator [Bacillota bacterium]
MNLVDVIEMYIKALLDESMDNVIQLRRNELAQYFGCAPSQINYVIQTRFNPQRGYITESQRGGGGYIRLIRLDLDNMEKILSAFEQLEEEVSQRQAQDFLCWLREQGLIDNREAQMMAAVVAREVLDVPAATRRKLRYRILWAMIEAIIKEG